MSTRETKRIAPPAQHAQSSHRRTHLIIWSIALAVLVCTAAIVAARYALVGQFDGLVDDRHEIVGYALAQLNEDPSMSEEATQRMVRHAAVYAEQAALETAEGDYLRARQYRQERNLKGSEIMFKRAISRRPGWSRPHAALGALLGRHTVGRIAEAERELRRAIELDPEWHQPWDDLAVTLRLGGRPEEAEEAARKAVILAPDAVAPKNNLANLLVELGHYREAEEYFLEAIDLRPSHPKPWYNLACLYSLLEREEESVYHLRQAIQRAAVLRNEAAADSDFDPIRDTPAFQQLVYGVVTQEEETPSARP